METLTPEPKESLFRIAIALERIASQLEPSVDRCEDFDGRLRSFATMVVDRLENVVDAVNSLE